MNRCSICLALFAVLGASQPALARPQALTIKQAEALAFIAILTRNPHAERLQGFGVERSKNRDFPPFETFNFTWDNPGGEGYNLGTYDVNMNNGDVWELFCFEIRNPTLAKTQRKLRKNLGITQKNYKKLRVRGPYC